LERQLPELHVDNWNKGEYFAQNGTNLWFCRPFKFDRLCRILAVIASAIQTISLRRARWLAFLAWMRLVRLVMANRATCRRAELAVSGHMPRDPADDRAFDTSLRLGLKRRDCGDDDQRGENSKLNFHVATYFFANARSTILVIIMMVVVMMVVVVVMMIAVVRLNQLPNDGWSIVMIPAIAIIILRQLSVARGSDGFRCIRSQ
jgi:hypothetical protein